MKYLVAYVVALALFLVLDLIWLGIVAKGLYAERIGSLLLDQPRWGVAAVFYALYILGLLYFAISASLPTGDWQRAALNGALFGFFSYLTYNATNLSVMKGYDGLIAMVDTGWGTVLGAVVSAGTVLIMGMFSRAG